jgi:transposase
LGVRSEEESDWLRWEMRYERRIMKRRKRFQNLRRETYTLAVRELRKHYAEFVFESERIHDARTPRAKRGTTIRELQTEDAMVRRKRANRDLTARYEFVSLCERFGAELITVPSRNTTRECPTCGHIGENGPELLAACPACGTVRDKDRGAAVVILRRAEDGSSDHAAE